MSLFFQPPVKLTGTIMKQHNSITLFHTLLQTLPYVALNTYLLIPKGLEYILAQIPHCFYLYYSAHNNTVFDTRFQTSRINQRLISLLETETGITNLDFRYIDAYVVLITYTLRKMGETKTSCKQFISAFITCTDTLRSQLSATANVCNQILGTQQRSHLSTLQNFLSNS